MITSFEFLEKCKRELNNPEFTCKYSEEIPTENNREIILAMENGLVKTVWIKGEVYYPLNGSKTKNREVNLPEVSLLDLEKKTNEIKGLRLEIGKLKKQIEKLKK